MYLENLGGNPYLIVILNHGGNIKPQEFFEAMNSTFVQPPLRALFSQFKHFSASSICETTTDAVDKIKIDKSSGPIELLLQLKKKNQPAKLKTRKGRLRKK